MGLLREFFTTDGANIQHLTECDVTGCAECDYLMEFYEACDACGVWGHKDTMTYDQKSGETYCELHGK